MEKITALEAQVLPVTKIIVKNGDEQKEYSLVLDFNAIAKAQKELGRDLANIKQWDGLTSSDMTVVAWAALNAFHPEVTLEQVRSWLAPANVDQLFCMLVEQCYPGLLDRVEAHMKAEALRKAAGNPPVPTPGPSAPAKLEA